MTPSGPLLVTVTSPGSYQLMRYLAMRLKQCGRRSALLYIGGEDERFRRIAEDAHRLGIDSIAFGAYVGRCRDGYRLSINPLRRAAFHVAGLMSKKPLSFRAFMRHLSIELAAARDLIGQYKPSALIVAENGISGPLTLLSQAYHEGVVCVTVPYGNGRTVDLEIDQDRKRAAGEQIIPTGIDRIFLKLLAANWIKCGPHEGATMFEPAYIFALESLGLTLNKPWICHGGPSHIMCAENVVGYKQYIDEGMDPVRVKLTGSPYCDEMVEALACNEQASSAFLKPRFIDPTRPRILVSWPPDYHSTHVDKSEFPTYAEMTDTYFSLFKSLEYCDVTFSMHPDAGEAGASAVERNGIQPTCEHLVGLFPLHDIFVTFFSSATRWAIAAGKPVLNINLYDQNIRNYEHLPGVVHARSFSEFSTEIRKMVTDPSYYSQLATHQIQAASEYGILDGECVSRIIQEIDANCSKA